MVNLSENIITNVAIFLVLIFIILSILAMITRPKSRYESLHNEINELEGKDVVFVYDDNYCENADGVRGYLVPTSKSIYKPTFYEKVIKRLLDIILSFFGLILLSPIFLIVSIIIKIEDPGPIFFTQKRIGKNKQYFKLHKFRSMKMDTPKDTPTHMLENPDFYITKIGRFLRAHSLDELPQIWDIFIGNMSLIGPRPALWNQDLLIAERDKYSVNYVKPGLSGLAQIRGRDELSIQEKSKLDGLYVQKLSFKLDVYCFFASIGVVARDESIVEGRK